MPEEETGEEAMNIKGKIDGSEKLEGSSIPEGLPYEEIEAGYLAHSELVM